MAQIGQLINGKFQILRLIDRGGMSRIYLARDLQLNKEWVVKEVPKYKDGKDNFLAVNAALSEADIIKSLDHPAVVRIVGISQDSRAVYIIEDHVAGMSLKRKVETQHTLPEAELLNWAVQLCELLVYLHGRKPPIIYRDLKPENIILTESGHIRLVDFGIARRYHPGKTRDTVYMGTRDYAAPEQYEDYGAQTDGRTDIYALGRTLRFLADYCDDLSGAFRSIILRCQEQNPESRYQSAAELLEELKHPGQREKKPVLNKRALAAAFLAGIIVFCGLLAVVLRVDIFKTGGNAVESYLELVRKIGEDNVFSEEEEEQLYDSLLPYLSELKEKEGFEKLAYHIGELYWYCYRYGTGSSCGMAEAAEWFRLARGYCEAAGVYEVIGRFHGEVEIVSDSTGDEGTFRTFFYELLAALKKLTGAQIQETEKQELYLQTVNLLDTWLWRFAGDGIDQEAVSEVLDMIREDAPLTPLMEERLRHADAALPRVYSDNGSESR